MAPLRDIICVEAERHRGSRRPDVQAESVGITGRLHEALAPLLRDAPDAPLLEGLRSMRDAHPGMSAGMALYWLRRQPRWGSRAVSAGWAADGLPRHGRGGS
jgi:hypothetical protein